MAEEMTWVINIQLGFTMTLMMIGKLTLATLIKTYVAIYENRIQFSVGNNWMLNKGTLKETLYSVKKKYEEKNKTDRDLKNIDDFLSVLSDGSIQRIIKIENVGKFKFGISLEGLNNFSKKLTL